MGDDILLTALVTIIIFLVMISLHEFGHFIVSKAVGVKVHEFAIGMGPAILKFHGKETLYSLRIFPVGGYCKLEGEDEKTEDERAFCNQKWWKRFAVVVAGAVLNVILGFVILFVITMNVGTVRSTVVDTLVENSYLETSGVMPGDRIVAINGKHIGFYPDISLYTEKLTDSTEVEITVKRNGEKLKYRVRPSKETSTTYYEDEYVRMVTDINGTGEQEQTLDYTDKEAAKDYIGQSFTNERYILGFTAKEEETHFLNSAVYAWHNTVYVVKLVYNGLWDMVTGKTGIEQVSGPVGIVSAVNTMVHSGKYWVMNVLNLSALLTINLGVFNLLPLPALDGGRILFMLIELVRRKPVPAEKEGLVHAVGLMLLLLFAVVISFKDIIMLIK